MSEVERKEFIRAIDKATKRLKSDKEASKDFLVKLGILTEKGNLRKAYKM